MPRNRISGEVAFAADCYDDEGTLGVITDCRLRDHKPAELGYVSVLPIITVYGCAGQFEHKLDWYFSPGRQEWAERIIRGEDLSYEDHLRGA